MQHEIEIGRLNLIVLDLDDLEHVEDDRFDGITLDFKSGIRHVIPPTTAPQWYTRIAQACERLNLDLDHN